VKCPVLVNLQQQQRLWESGKRVAFSKAAQPPSLCAEHVRQLGGESPLHNLMEVK